MPSNRDLQVETSDLKTFAFAFRTHTMGEESLLLGRKPPMPEDEPGTAGVGTSCTWAGVR